MVMKKWINRWNIPSSTSDGTWTVAMDRDGNYGCSCPVWKFRREECHHIRQVKGMTDEILGAQLMNRLSDATPKEAFDTLLEAYEKSEYMLVSIISGETLRLSNSSDKWFQETFDEIKHDPRKSLVTLKHPDGDEYFLVKELVNLEPAE